MAPFGHPKSTKIHPKVNPKRHPKNDRFLDRFFAQVGSMLAPKLGPKSRSRRSQNAPKTLARRPQDSPRATRASKIEIWSIFGAKVRWGTPPWPRFSRFLARLNSNVGAKFALGNLESFTSNFKIRKVNSSTNHPMSTQTSINFPST